MKPYRDDSDPAVKLERHDKRITVLERRAQTSSLPTSRYSNEIINDPTGGLVLYWKLDELGNTTTDAVDSSGNGHTGSYQASPRHPTLGVGALADGTSALFDGFDDALGLDAQPGQIPGIQGFGQMSIEFWVKTSQTSHLDGSNSLDTSVATLVTSDYTDFAGFGFFVVFLTLATGHVKYRIWETGGASHTLDGATVINDGARHHIVCTFDGTTMSIYVDGVLDVSSTPTMAGPLQNQNNGFWVGSYPELGHTNVWPHSHFGGVLDEIALYTIALPLSSVQTHYLIGSTASNPPVGTAGGVLAGNYPNPDLAASVAGNGLGLAADVLSVNVDASTIEIASDTLRVKNNGITASKLSLLVTDLLDAVARVKVSLGGVLKGTRRQLNFIAGANITFTITDDAVNEKVDVQIDSTGGGGASSLASDKKKRTSGDVTFTSTTFAVIDTALNITITTGARKCLVLWTVVAKNGQNPGAQQQVDVEIDGTRAGGTFGLVLQGTGTSSENANLSGSFLTDGLAAGSHTFKLMFRVDAGTSTIYASTTVAPIVFSVVELYA